MNGFQYHRPTSVSAAVSALASEGAQPLAGGQTLIPTLKNRLASPDMLVSLTGIKELKQIITAGDGVIELGGTVTHAEAARSLKTVYPALASLAANIGDPAVRNRGTIGGSLANNDPSACYPAAALAGRATIHTNRRSVAADEFFDGMFSTALDADEIITRVSFPVPGAASYQKFEQPASRFALVGVFVARFDDAVRVAVTGASQDGVYRWREAEQALWQEFSPSVIASLTVPSDGMIEDLHGTGRYRANLVKVMTKRAVAAA